MKIFVEIRNRNWLKKMIKEVSMPKQKCKICDYPLDFPVHGDVCNRHTEFRNVTKHQSILIKKKANQIFCEPGLNDFMVIALANHILKKLKEK